MKMVGSTLRYQLNAFVAANKLPKAFNALIDTYYLPLASWVNDQRSKNSTWIVGLSGAQGTGKSTLGALLKLILEESYACKTALVSLDDLYLTAAEREGLAKTVHPLLQTRGVPGTHDIKLGMKLLNDLSHLQAHQTLLLPRFNKVIDDRVPKDAWEVFSGPADVVILEGWCVGVEASSSTELVSPINALEALEDQNGQWRHYVNQKLQTDYRRLFSCNKALIMLQAPNFECVHSWRWAQEQQLVAQMPARDSRVNKLMGEDDITRFIQHYERLTRQSLLQLPQKADVVLTLDEAQNIVCSAYKSLE